MNATLKQFVLKNKKEFKQAVHEFELHSREFDRKILELLRAL